MTMPFGQTPSSFTEAVSPMTHDICITLLGSQPTVQRMKESKSDLITTWNREESEGQRILRYASSAEGQPIYETILLLVLYKNTSPDGTPRN